MAVMETTSTQAWLDRYAVSVAGVLPSYFDVVAERGEGSWLIDIDGRRYLDLGSGIAVTSLGHCHPRVTAAIEAQARTLVHTSVVVRHPGYIALAERLGACAPFLREPQVFLCNSGAEAVDGSLKLSRQATGKGGVIAFRHAFHGRTLAATSLTTAKPRYRDGYEPLLGGVSIAPYCVPQGFASEDDAVRAALADLDAILAAPAGGIDVGAIIVEPVLGEGGYVVPPAAWLHGLRERCDAHGIVLIFDEVQSGIGRTGSMFAAERFGVAPDVVLSAKALASGLPLGAILAGRELMERWPEGTHGSTFGGNPVACAAALATLDVIAEEGLCARATHVGQHILDRLRRSTSGLPSVREVRGLGLMVGIELPDKATASAVREACLDAGVIVLTCGPGENVLRLIPPLTISDDDLDHGLTVLELAMASASA